MLAVDLRHQDIKYSLRRYYVDEFLTQQAAGLVPGSLVLDVGGVRIKKRGQFDLAAYPVEIITLNLVTGKQPHIQADAGQLPLCGRCADAVICSEVLEHVPDPRPVISEAHRVLKPGGMLLVTVPFLHRIHADPYDYGRYTAYFWQQNLLAAGFQEIAVEKQGLFWSVLVEMLRGLVQHRISEGGYAFRPWRSLNVRAVAWARRKIPAWEARTAGHPYNTSFTTGFGIKAIRSK